MTVRPPSLVLVPIVVACLLVLGAAAALPQAAAASAPVRSYRGLGSWVDMYDARAWDDPAAALKDMQARGVRTLFLETANYHLPADSSTMFRRDDAGRLIQEAHARGIKVVAWYLPGFKDPAKDYRRSMAAIRYRTPDGQAFDSFTLDIEASIVKDVDVRTSRLRSLSNRIRAAVGPTYPLGACIPSPAGMVMHASYWPRFPYKTLAGIYDVFVPMGYYTYHGDGYANAYRDTRDNIRIIREKTGRPGIPIHVIAGDGAKSSGSETTAYVRALRENGALGGSMYDWATTNDASWRALRERALQPAPVAAAAAHAAVRGAPRVLRGRPLAPQGGLLRDHRPGGRPGAALPPLRRAGRRGPAGRELAGHGAARRRAGQGVERHARGDHPGVAAQAAGAQRDRLRRPRRVPGLAALGRPRRDHLRTLRRLAP